MGLFPSLTGELYLLGWNNHDTQDNIIVSKTKESALKTFDCLMKKRNIEKVLFFMRVEVVAPPQKYEEKCAKQQYQRDISHFWEWIIGNLELRNKRNLPGFITRCPHCIKKPAYSRICEVCCEGFVPTRGSLESVYLEKKDLFLKELAPLAVKNQKQRPSKAPIYLGNDVMYYVNFAFGHHSGGTGFDVVDYERYVIDEDVGFFFLKKEGLDIQPVKDKLETYKEEFEAFFKQKLKSDTIKGKQQKKAIQEKILSKMSLSC